MNRPHQVTLYVPNFSQATNLPPHKQWSSFHCGGGRSVPGCSCVVVGFHCACHSML